MSILSIFPHTDIPNDTRPRNRALVVLSNVFFCILPPASPTVTPSRYSYTLGIRAGSLSICFLVRHFTALFLV